MKKIFYTSQINRLGLLGLLFVLFAGVPVRAAGEPDLTIAKTHIGTFAPLDTGRTYSITVSNIGESPTTGTVTVVDTLPSGLSATAIGGDGWSCVLATLTCNRSDALNNGEDYPVITVTVNVLVGATDPQINRADVSGGGEVDTDNNTALDPTTVDAKPDLVITGYELRDGPYPTGNLITAPNPDETFWIWMTMQNRGGSDSGNFYPGVFLDDKPNYGPDHDETGPPLLTLGEVTDYQGYRITPPGAVDGAGCMYYDPTDSINPLSSSVFAERGNYTRTDLLPSLPAGATSTVSVEISYPAAQYPNPIYDNDNVREGLKAGSYNIYLYADPNCAGGDEESDETNNAYGPITINVNRGIVVADFDGNGATDKAVFRPSNGVWYILGGASVQYGGAGDIPVPGDYDGDGITDKAVFRPSNGVWYILGGASVQYGGAGDIPVPGDYDGDGITDKAVFRPSNGVWYILGGTSVQYGGDGDIPVPGDYGGDGITDKAVFRPSNGVWYILGGASVQYGGAGDIPVPGDYDGDGITDKAVFRPSNGVWYILSGTSVQYGGNGDFPLPARDTNGDGYPYQ